MVMTRLEHRLRKADAQSENFNLAYLDEQRRLVDKDGQVVGGGGSISSDCMFYLPGRQFPGSGNVRDLSGNAADAVLGTTLTDAEAWANPGYVTARTDNDEFPSVPLNKSNFDLCQDSVIFAVMMRQANPAANTVTFGNATAVPGANGFYISTRIGGRVRPVIQVPGGFFSSLADSAAIFADDTDHHLLVAFDELTGEVKLYRDGVLSDAYPANSFSRTGNATPTGRFGLFGGNASTSPGVAGRFYGAQLYRKRGVGLPNNLNLLAAKLAANPAGFLAQGEIEW